MRRGEKFVETVKEAYERHTSQPQEPLSEISETNPIDIRRQWLAERFRYCDPARIPKETNFQRYEQERYRGRKQNHYISKHLESRLYQSTILALLEIIIEINQPIPKSKIEKITLMIRKGEHALTELERVARQHLDASRKSPFSIRKPQSNLNQEILKKLEEVIGETKQSKRLTFKSTEEIKTLLAEAGGAVAVDQENPEERTRYTETIIELYDMLYHFVRMLKKNGQQTLGNEFEKQLRSAEEVLKNVDLQVLDTEGKEIDASFMEAVGTVTSEQANGLPQYHVADEIIRGFVDLRKEKLIREAKVITVLN